MKLNQSASACRRCHRALLQWHLGKSPEKAWNNHPSHNANTGRKARDQERRKDREGSSNYSYFLTPIWFGCRHCLWTHLETLLYNYSLTHALMGPNKRGRGLTYHSLMNSCHHFLLLGCWNEHELALIVVLCQVFSFQQQGHTCSTLQHQIPVEKIIVLAYY